jgi:hypothetical protein
MVGLTIYCIGCIIACGLNYAIFPNLKNEKEIGMLVVGTLMSWITVIMIIINYIKDGEVK